ncbi:unnamed protein product [Ilex paraguariensis]|uniref:Uncharacterized protein n=1 Tax=Ilex paraguariensis TaxID=185542 RepID=A0ABC8UE43_9AQUA
MSSPEKQLEEQLMEAGNKLLQPPPSVDELLPLLDQVENFLSRVEQSPPKSTHTALSPSMKALVADELLRHSDVDVKVAVASCISEITRITAPDAPYDDDRMKDIFQLIVSSFENLSDQSSRSYNKRALILETVAKVRSCVVMLDLECDGLIVEMFQHFLKAIRDFHPENVFSSMETIMTLVLEESEEIPLELLTPILATVKKNNEGVLPIALKLGERVLENCAVKLKPYLAQAVSSLGVSLDDYSKVVASVCEGRIGTVQHNGDIAIGKQLAPNVNVQQLVDDNNLDKASSAEAVQADENKLATAASEVAPQVTKNVTEEACTEDVDPAAERSPKPVMSNGSAEAANDGTMVDPESLKKPEHGHVANQSVDANATNKVDTDESDAGKSVKAESKREETAKTRGRKPDTLMSSTDPSDSSLVDSEKEAEKLADRKKNGSEDIHISPAEDPSAVAEACPKNEETDVQLSSPKALESEALNIASPSPNGNLPDEARPKKVGRPKKWSLIQEDAPPADVISKKVSEGTSDSEVKPQRRSGKKATAVIYKDKIPAVVETTQNEAGTTSDSEAKPQKQSGKKVGASNDIESKSSPKKKEDGKRRARGKDTSEKDGTKFSAKDDAKDIVSSPKSATKSAKHESQLQETPKKNQKRKRTAGEEQASEAAEYGENLVGSKVKVWWPKDHMFYEGVIDSFDPVKKKHKVLYTDGDEETLNLGKERWEFVKGDSASDEEQATEDLSHDASSEMHKRKKSKAQSEPLAMELSPKRGGAASFSKSKGTSGKSGHKSREDGKVDSKLKDSTSKSSGKKSSGKSIDEAPRAAGKSKDVDGDTAKTATKSKQETPKNVTKSKGKTPQSGNKSTANGMGKVKSSSSKGKETDGGKGKSSDSMKTSESVKAKSLESGAKSGKKRRRGIKS